jgi:hypothetical protein
MKQRRLWTLQAFSLLLGAGLSVAQAQIADGGHPASYDGDWWLSSGGWEQYGFLSGYTDCYVAEYHGSVPFAKDVQTYADALTRYYQESAERRKQTVSEALDAIRGAAGDKSGPPAAGTAAADAQGPYDGKFWFDADPAAEVGFVAGYLACHAAKVKDADGKFSKAPADYVPLINEAYGITDDTDDIDPQKAPIRIGDVLHRLRDAAPAPEKPGAAALHLSFRLSASRSLMNAWRVTPMRLASSSIARNISSGKSTFTRWTSRPGRLACANSRCALRSFPASCRASSSAAVRALVGEVPRLFVPARPADRDDADRFIGVGYKS